MSGSANIEKQTRSHPPRLTPRPGTPSTSTTRHQGQLSDSRVDTPVLGLTPSAMAHSALLMSRRMRTSVQSDPVILRPGPPSFMFSTRAELSTALVKSQSSHDTDSRSALRRLAPTKLAPVVDQGREGGQREGARVSGKGLSLILKRTQTTRPPPRSCANAPLQKEPNRLALSRLAPSNFVPKEGEQGGGAESRKDETSARGNRDGEHVSPTTAPSPLGSVPPASTLTAELGFVQLLAAQVGTRQVFVVRLGQVAWLKKKRGGEERRGGGGGGGW